MSGGSMDYLFGRVADARFRRNTALRRAFHKHLQLVSAALRAIEWNDSGDGDDSEQDAIRACLGPAGEVVQVLAELREATATAQRLLAKHEEKS